MTIHRTGMLVAMLWLSGGLLTAQQPAQPMPHPTQRERGDSALALQPQMRMMDSMAVRLDSLVARMNKSTGKAQVAAMADVINELVAQRKAMHAQMRTLMEARRGMMEDMMGEEPAGERPQPPAAPDSSATDSGHAGHHPKP